MTKNTHFIAYGFEMQRSKNSLNFSRVGFIKVNGTETTFDKYHYVDEDKLKVEEYYHCLKQINYICDFEYTSVIRVSLSAPKELFLYPNKPISFTPSTSNNFVKSSHINIKFYNAIGQKMYKFVDTFNVAGRISIQCEGVKNLRKR